MSHKRRDTSEEVTLLCICWIIVLSNRMDIFGLVGFRMIFYLLLGFYSEMKLLFNLRPCLFIFEVVCLTKLPHNPAVSIVKMLLEWRDQVTLVFIGIYTAILRINVHRFISPWNHCPLCTWPYVQHCRQITAIVLLYHNVNKTCPLISSNIIIRGPGWRCYSTNICKAMHHLRCCLGLCDSHNIHQPLPPPLANVNYHISPWHLSVMANMSYVKSVSLCWRWTWGEEGADM